MSADEYKRQLAEGERLLVAMGDQAIQLDSQFWDTWATAMEMEPNRHFSDITITFFYDPDIDETYSYQMSHFRDVLYASGVIKADYMDVNGSVDIPWRMEDAFESTGSREAMMLRYFDLLREPLTIMLYEAATIPLEAEFLGTDDDKQVFKALDKLLRDLDYLIAASQPGIMDIVQTVALYDEEHQ